MSQVIARDMEPGSIVEALILGRWQVVYFLGEAKGTAWVAWKEKRWVLQAKHVRAIR